MKMPEAFSEETADAVFMPEYLRHLYWNALYRFTGIWISVSRSSAGVSSGLLR